MAVIKHDDVPGGALSICFGGCPVGVAIGAKVVVFTFPGDSDTGIYSTLGIAKYPFESSPLLRSGCALEPGKVEY